MQRKIPAGIFGKNLRGILGWISRRFHARFLERIFGTVLGGIFVGILGGIIGRINIHAEK